MLKLRRTGHGAVALDMMHRYISGKCIGSYACVFCIIVHSITIVIMTNDEVHDYLTEMTPTTSTGMCMYHCFTSSALPPEFQHMQLHGNWLKMTDQQHWACCVGQ